MLNSQSAKALALNGHTLVHSNPISSRLLLEGTFLLRAVSQATLIKCDETFEINPVNHFSIMINTFCQEITGEKKSSFNFEKELKNQARVMQAHRVSAEEKRFVCLNEIN